MRSEDEQNVIKLKPIITITSDFGHKDPYLAAVKGVLYTELSDPTLVDISHEIAPFDIAQAAYIIHNSYQHYPEGSIHLICIDTEIRPDNPPLVVSLNNHFFVCPDNGVLSLVTPHVKPDKITQIDHQTLGNNSFSSLTVFARAAAHLARGGAPNIIGKPIEQIKTLSPFTPTVGADKKLIQGKVIYVDNYENVITNISKKLFEKIGQERTYVVEARNNRFTKIQDSYGDLLRFDTDKRNRTEDGKPLALFNASGLLELAMYRSNPLVTGGASSLFGLEYLDVVSIRFQ